MNQRIKQLAEQAGLLPKEIGPAVETQHMKKKQQGLAKFAELIVKECSQLAHNSHPDELPFVGSKILEHFGVER